MTELGSPDLHPHRGAVLLCIRSLEHKIAALLCWCSHRSFPAPHSQRAQSKAACALPSCPRGPSLWHHVPKALTDV